MILRPELILAVTVLSLFGCAGDTPPGAPAEPKLATSSSCHAALVPMRCRLENDLAGGYPYSPNER